MAGAVLNSWAFLAALDKAERQVVILFRKRVQTLLTEGMRRLIAKTPVNSGQAVMNYVATAGRPYSGGVKDGLEVVEPTNHLSLGAEQNRAPAAAVAMATLATVDFTDPFKVFWITNRSPNIGGLELGLLPQAPYTPRSPQGLFGVAVQELAALLQSGRV